MEIRIPKLIAIGFVVLVCFPLFSMGALVFAEDPTPTVTTTPTASSSASTEELQNRIKELQAKVDDLRNQGNTLSSQISAMDSQINLTELRIDATKQEISNLGGDIDTVGGKIVKLEGSLEKLSKALIARIRAAYETGSTPQLNVLLTSGSASDFTTRLSYLKVAQARDRELLMQTQQAKTDYANQKNVLEDKKEKVEALNKQLVAYTDQLNQDKDAKQQLLTVTKNDEARYQKLLSDAQKQLSAFKSFANYAGGASILPPQPSPDGWYYNQRDERWGKTLIGYSSEQVWDVGCLITAVAMVLKKHGENITPSDVARNTGYFFSNTAYMLHPWGGRFYPSSGYNQGAVDSKLASGEPVIVGVTAGAYGMHFIVLKSGSGGDYTMNDPWYGPDLKFTDYYSTGQIFQYGYL